MFEFEDNLSTGFHDVFLSKYSVSRINKSMIPTQQLQTAKHTKKNTLFILDTITKQETKLNLYIHTHKIANKYTSNEKQKKK